MGGWLNKVVPLVKAVLDEDWWNASAIATSYAEHPSVAPLLEKAKGKGKGHK